MSNKDILIHFLRRLSQILNVVPYCVSTYIDLRDTDDVRRVRNMIYFTMLPGSVQL